MNDSMNVAGEVINKPASKEVRTRSRFPSLSYHLYNTERFGEYNSFFVMDAVEGDSIPIRSGGKVESYTLKAPLMQSISKKKDLYSVPMEAILPINWPKIYTNPVIGDDVPEDCNTGVANFWNKVGGFSQLLLSRSHTLITTASSTPTDIITGILRTLVTLEYFYSNGSLIRSLGCSGSRYFHVLYNYNGAYLRSSFDKWFDKVMEVLTTIVKWVSFEDSDGFTKYCVFQPSVHSGLENSVATANVHDLLAYFRDDLNCRITGVPSATTQAILSTNLADFFNPSSTVWAKTIADPEVNYNLNRLWAYQLTVAHFYSNDHVDYIYSADLFRSLISYYVLSFVSQRHFALNGINIQYDYLSAYYFTKTIEYVTASNANMDAFLTDYSSVNPKCVRGYLSALLAYRRSLRFVDYFVGARTRPLAIGDVNVDVNSGSPDYVSVIDVSRNIQRQRFFNAVNRFGRKFEEYVKGLSGVNMSQDFHNPLYLGHTQDVVYGIEVENTGADQLTKSNSVTSRFTSNGSRYQFEVRVDRPSVIIGLSYYDISRAYLYNCERPLFHMNRFDMFNPYMQFIGDQEVYFDELGSFRALNYHGPFGYQLRHMEYKQRYDQAAGGFIENLPGWLFTSATDENRSNGGTQSVDFIRSLPGEIDDFYVSLTGFSLGSYFHFIVDNDNYCDASRPMAYAPTIL